MSSLITEKLHKLFARFILLLVLRIFNKWIDESLNYLVFVVTSTDFSTFIKTSVKTWIQDYMTTKTWW